MTSIFPVLLCLGLCLGQRMRTEEDKPFLRADKGLLVPLGSSVTLRCQYSLWADICRLEKEQESERILIQDVKPSGGEAQFLIRNVTLKDAGIYSCLYSCSSSWSKRSDPLELVVTGILIGIPVFLILLFLFLLLFLCHQYQQRKTRLRNEDKEAEAKKTTRSSDPAGTLLEDTLYVDMSKDIQTEEARPEDMAAPQKEVTYAQLNLNSLKTGPGDSPHSGPGEPSLYAVLR
ncbi:leukocyte immunoglobulin-like receptor subfamily A member 6 isoform X7 [Macrotis lagotis]|uniref:leukocyte immunoglobulin-like receptor subfamily A member 6 isoform X7 n=1 Tax=Macrotis lagotis TaxID=92651 RepID=UPI003D68D410